MPSIRIAAFADVKEARTRFTSVDLPLPVEPMIEVVSSRLGNKANVVQEVFFGTWVPKVYINRIRALHAQAG